MISRDEIMAEAKRRGVRSAELIPLAPQNDPFFCGAPAQERDGLWFAEMWHRFGFVRGVHLRRIHYRLVSVDPPVMGPDGEPYQNTEKCWQKLTAAGKFARYLGYIDPQLFEDRRNPEPVILTNYGYGRPGVHVSYGYELPPFNELLDWPELDPPGLTASGYDDVFPGHHVEVWAEKTTMNDELLPVCRRHRVNLVTGAGELSITAAVAFLQRVAAAERPARILYVSDFDPAGLQMPNSVARKVEFYQRRLADDFGELDIRLIPLVLTLDQVKHYRLPRTPIKDTDRRKKQFVDTFGAGAVELDALEANYPGVLADMVRDAIGQYRDYSMTSRAKDTEDELQQRLDEDAEAVREWHGADDLIAEYSKLCDEMAAALRPFDERYQDIADRWQAMISKLYNGLQEAADDVDLDDYPLPMPELPDEPPALYDSRRGYWAQLEHYKSQQQNGHK